MRIRRLLLQSDSNHIAIRLALTLGFDSKPGRFAPNGQLRFGATGSGRCLRADAPGEVGSDQSIQARFLKGFTGRAQSSPPPFTPHRERASGKALAFIGSNLQTGSITSGLLKITGQIFLHLDSRVSAL
jgi:hypothetical protein